MIDVDMFYNQACTPDIFEHGEGLTPRSSQTKVSSILSKFIDDKEMKSRSSPTTWLPEFYQKKGLEKDKYGGGFLSSIVY